jgi:uncharacterized protein
MEVAVRPQKNQVKLFKMPKKTDQMTEIIRTLGSSHGPHGQWHWEKVDYNAIALCKKVPEADLAVCRLFAILHDSQRTNDDDDQDHGERAANYILSIEPTLNLNQTQINKLVEACRHHNKGLISNDPTIGVCWDADRLDLTRVNIIPDRELLSTQDAKYLQWTI